MRLSPEARRRLAGEYVLGTLRGQARRWFARYLGSSAQGRAEVAWWQERLHGLSRRQSPALAVPAPAVWDRIASLTVATPVAAPRPEAATEAPVVNRVSPAAPVPMPGPAATAMAVAVASGAANDPRFVPRARLRAWQAATGLAAAASLALVGVLALRPPQVVTRTRIVTTPAPVTAPAGRPWLAMLNAPAAAPAPGKPAEANPRWVVVLSETDARQPTAPGRLRIRADGPGYQLPPGRALELWVIGAAGPESLGVIPATGSATLALPAGRRLPANPTLAVSVEPSGGSPSGSPTGPVILTAPAVQAF